MRLAVLMIVAAFGVAACSERQEDQAVNSTAATVDNFTDVVRNAANTPEGQELKADAKALGSNIGGALKEGAAELKEGARDTKEMLDSQVDENRAKAPPEQR